MAKSDILTNTNDLLASTSTSYIKWWLLCLGQHWKIQRRIRSKLFYIFFSSDRINNCKILSIYPILQKLRIQDHLSLDRLTLLYFWHIISLQDTRNSCLSRNEFWWIAWQISDTLQRWILWRLLWFLRKNENQHANFRQWETISTWSYSLLVSIKICQCRILAILLWCVLNVFKKVKTESCSRTFWYGFR